MFLRYKVSGVAHVAKSSVSIFIASHEKAIDARQARVAMTSNNLEQWPVSSHTRTNKECASRVS